jgi:hypothetical protein
MNFYIGLFVWILIAAMLAGGVVLATKGSFILLIAGLILFVGGFIKFGCLMH